MSCQTPSTTTSPMTMSTTMGTTPPLLPFPHGSGSNGAIQPVQAIATSSSIALSPFAPFVPPQGMDLGDMAPETFQLPSGGTSLHDSPGSNQSALMLAQSPSQSSMASPERAAKRRLPSPARMVDVGRVAHPLLKVKRQLASANVKQTPPSSHRFRTP